MPSLLQFFVTLAVLLLLIVVTLTIFAQPIRAWAYQRESQQAMTRFKRQREQMEARFFDVASRLGKPRGLRWLACEWMDDVSFARDRQTGLLTAFISVNISFEAIEGGDMEDVAAVGNIRDAAAVFHYSSGSWGTGGRALFNMNAAEAPQRLQNQFEAVVISAT